MSYKIKKLNKTDRPREKIAQTYQELKEVENETKKADQKVEEIVDKLGI